MTEINLKRGFQAGDCRVFPAKEFIKGRSKGKNMHCLELGRGALGG